MSLKIALLGTRGIPASYSGFETCVEELGQRLVERLPVYPEYLLRRPEFFHPRVRRAALRLADDAGHARSPRPGSRAEAA